MPRKRRRAKHRRADEQLYPELIEVLLGGWASPTWPEESAEWPRVFELKDEDFRREWRTHRHALLEEWQRRNLPGQPYAVEQGWEQDR